MFHTMVPDIGEDENTYWLRHVELWPNVDSYLLRSSTTNG